MEKIDFVRIPLSFHATFAPERFYIAKLLACVSVRCHGSFDDISNMTGIPTGKSSGKVEPTIRYAQGMGLVDVAKEGSSGFFLSLTPLGEIVFGQDPYLKEELTQWLLHLMFCRCHGGAEAWYAVFGEGRLPLGESFTKENLRNYLENCFGRRRDVIGPLLRMYLHESGFLLCGAIIEEKAVIRRKKAPLDPIFYYLYAYWMINLWNQIFPNDQQITISAFESKSKCFSTLGWVELEVSDFLDWLSDAGVLKIDRQTGEALLLRMMAIETIENHIYDNLI